MSIEKEQQFDTDWKIKNNNKKILYHGKKVLH